MTAEVESLSAAYRGPRRARAARTPTQVAAYLAYRAPATYAAAEAAFAQVRVQRPDWRPHSLLDAGAGPGIATLAAIEQWPSLTSVRLVDVEPAMLAAGKVLLPDATWEQGDVSSARGPADLVLASYVLGELDDVERAAAHLWDQAADTVVFVEPGTPEGYRRVLGARAATIAAGGHTVAPCPHDLACPLVAPDWCHFAVRLPRSKLHRRAKAVELGHEDEKFSYAALSREQVPKAQARVIRQPQVRSGHVNLVTSELDGVHTRTVSRKQGGLYREARGAAWGAAIDLGRTPPP